MSDPRALWAAAAGTSKRKSVSIIWPELAAALGGEAATATAEPQPLCARCTDGRLAIARNDHGTPLCGRHAADEHLVRSKHRVDGWMPGYRQ